MEDGVQAPGGLAMTLPSTTWPSLDTDAARCQHAFGFMNPDFSDCTLRVYCTSKQISQISLCLTELFL